MARAEQRDLPGPAGASTSAWYGEISRYNFADPSASGPGASGHFTQLVWKASTKVGFGRAFGKGSKYWETYAVANFSPASESPAGVAACRLPPSCYSVRCCSVLVAG
ncbi:CAP domain-containing protein [Micromonospora sp. NPDC005171]|uniref:CAP domain-containing protein n=1 Tax=Micromonospora sp. NPDC005171 TaxID=3156866 RepID=UPI0033BF6396